MSLTKKRVFLFRMWWHQLNIRSNEIRYSNIRLYRRLTAFIFCIVSLKAISLFKTNFRTTCFPLELCLVQHGVPTLLVLHSCAHMARFRSWMRLIFLVCCEQHFSCLPTLFPLLWKWKLLVSYAICYQRMKITAFVVSVLDYTSEYRLSPEYTYICYHIFRVDTGHRSRPFALYFTSECSVRIIRFVPELTSEVTTVSCIPRVPYFAYECWLISVFVWCWILAKYVTLFLPCFTSDKEIYSLCFRTIFYE